MPILLPIVPFNPLQTWRLHEICTWMTVGMLAYMIIVHGFIMLLVKWPDLPVAPDSIAGLMCYVCDSRMLGLFHEGFATVGEKSRKTQLQGMRAKYFYGRITGSSGKKRMGVDYIDEM
ncbi:hypothetical protein QBC47DRAFT_383984 [Echria macrotheca]|uniref:Uncharacterized protein n=1 Tax=Echria macrotheca TaxID=438768 RepID=A0AAJ0F4C7_9PEZI|nr:hypothetical protein QBC47DRAFT_383984 [Echria macrotheca]